MRMQHCVNIKNNFWIRCSGSFLNLAFFLKIQIPGLACRYSGFEPEWGFKMYLFKLKVVFGSHFEKLKEKLEDIMVASQVALVVKNSLSHAGDARDNGLIHELGVFYGGGNGKPFQYSCLKNSVGRRAWWATVHGASKS